jgi:hypothetical protein
MADAGILGRGVRPRANVFTLENAAHRPICRIHIEVESDGFAGRRHDERGGKVRRLKEVC